MQKRKAECFEFSSPPAEHTPSSLLKNAIICFEFSFPSDTPHPKSVITFLIAVICSCLSWRPMSHSPDVYFSDFRLHGSIEIKLEFVPIRIQSPFCDFHLLLDMSVSPSLSPLPQWNYGKMRDDNVIVITTAWPSRPAASRCFMDDADSISAKSFISVFVDCSQKLSVQHRLYLQSVSDLLAQSPLKVSDYSLFMHLFSEVLRLRERVMLFRLYFLK